MRAVRRYQPFFGLVPMAAPTGDISGELNITLDGDTLTAAAVVQVSGSAAINLADDTLLAAGSVAIASVLAVTLEGDTLVAAGTVAIAGVLSVTLEGDTLVAAGTVESDEPPVISSAPVVGCFRGSYLGAAWQRSELTATWGS